MMRWSEKLEALLLTLVGEGRTWDEIAEDFGCTAGAAEAQWRKIRSKQLDAGASPLKIREFGRAA